MEQEPFTTSNEIVCGDIEYVKLLKPGQRFRLLTFNEISSMLDKYLPTGFVLKPTEALLFKFCKVFSCFNMRVVDSNAVFNKNISIRYRTPMPAWKPWKCAYKMPDKPSSELATSVVIRNTTDKDVFIAEFICEIDLEHYLCPTLDKGFPCKHRGMERCYFATPINTCGIQRRTDDSADKDIQSGT